ncbi:MAG: c-type cytochrome [Gemmataceae bacterium]|nr:c-type cytochrome [Gemmataceae bacterium]MCI0743453.1 c-type cytochrome [Gemmataceae bacterium]
MNSRYATVATFSFLLFAMTLSALPFGSRLNDGTQLPEQFVPPPSKPLSPEDERKTIQLLPGFTIDLVASEPDVVDPVAMAFDERGRLYVAEMHGYPNGGLGTGAISSGKIKRLEDKDGDGVFESAAVFAEGLRFPTSVMPYGKGLLVANAPDLNFLEDTDGDGQADRSRVLYTGFDVANIQQLLSGFQWGLDNWVYACAGGKGGDIRSVENSKMPTLPLRGRGIRFKPDRPGSLEPTSGGGQFGLTADEWGHWFVATNSQHLRHIVLPDHYLARNPFLPVSAVTLDIPEHGAACKVFRISPFEAWRVERTRRRKEGADSKRFASTELIPGGFVTSGTSPMVYLADLFPKQFQGSVFICDPANNLILRDVLEPKGGATFVAKRGDPDREFLASTDNWFRPVWLTLGPDGAMYVADFYREVIETPLSLPEDMKKVLVLESQRRGRIWRIRPEGKYNAPRIDMTKSSARELVAYLEHPNVWWRMTAQRLLVSGNQQAVAGNVRKLFNKSQSPIGRVHALWTLEGLGRLDNASILAALADDSAGVREQALRLAEPRIADSKDLRAAVVKLASDPSAKVRFQLAFTLGAANAPDLVEPLARLARQDGADSWTQIAILSSAHKSAASLFRLLMEDRRQRPALSFQVRLAQNAASTATDRDLAEIFLALGQGGKLEASADTIAILEGVGKGLVNSGRSIEKLWANPPAGLREALGDIKPMFAHMARVALEQKTTMPERSLAVRVLGYGPFDIAEKALSDLLAPQQPQELQLAAVRTLSLQQNTKVAPLLLGHWSSFGPTVRREASEALLSRPERVRALLAAIQEKKVLAGQLEPARLDQLRKYPDAKIRKDAAKLLAGQVAPDRQKVVEEYRPALEQKADEGRGKLVFRKNCITCHRLDNEGVEVGASLIAALPNKTAEQLLVDILDPSREVDPRYIDYLVTTTSGKVLTGLIAAETASSLTLRRAEYAEDTVLRSQIDTVTATAKSVMPEGLERQLSRQDLADLVAYLLEVARKK